MLATEVIFQPRKSLITVLLPIRVSEDRPDALDRLTHICLDRYLSELRPETIDILVVDDGSPVQLRHEIAQCCAELEFSLIRVESEGQAFSIGRCRNYCAMYAQSRYIFFQDVDLMPYDNFYHELCQEVSAHGLEENAADFIMIPFVYLTERGTCEFKNTPPAQRHFQFLHKALINDENIIEKLSTGTSATLYTREYYLARGGNDVGFSGWGYEDFEFNTRLIWHARKFPLPRDWRVDTGNFATVLEYRGWKAVYRLFGDLSFGKGLALFHAWHPVKETARYRADRDRNYQHFEACMKRFEKNGDEPEPLPSLCEGRTLLFRKSALTWSREIRPKLGLCIFASEDDFASADDLAEFCNARQITRILFDKPYENDRIARLCGWARARGLPILVAGRGALDGSFYFDPGGLLADRRSGQRARWDRPLTAAERTATLDRIDGFRRSTPDGEPLLVGAAEARRRLGLPGNRKVLLVALQRPDDEVTTAPPDRTTTGEQFLAMIGSVARGLPEDWSLVMRTDPPGAAASGLPGTIDPGATDLKDLLDLCDAVLSFKADAGLLALLWSKPVMLVGRAFYQHSGLNHVVGSASEVLAALHDPQAPDSETGLRFLHFLIFEFYSFGRLEERRVRRPDGTRTTTIERVDFEVVRGLGQHTSRFPARGGARHGWESLLFDRYRFGESVFGERQQRWRRLLRVAGVVKRRLAVKALTSAPASRPPKRTGRPPRDWGGGPTRLLWLGRRVRALRRLWRRGSRGAPG